jgi:uncharacterized membrane protein
MNIIKILIIGTLTFIFTSTCILIYGEWRTRTAVNIINNDKYTPEELEEMIRQDMATQNAKDTKEHI